ncbi:MAG: hypothetical protein ACRD8K_08420, partial [Nitrososphaeraceae archaeon]
MTELDDVMKENIAYIVYIEHRPFSFKDFHYFQVNEKQYTMKHGTFRNKISQMMQNDEVEIHTRSNPNFYTLKDCKFDNDTLMTGNHTGVKEKEEDLKEENEKKDDEKNTTIQKIIRHPLYQILEGTLFGERAVHNLHLTFNIQRIYDSLLNNPELKKRIHPQNKGIRFHYTDIDRFSIILSVYPTDTCQIVIGCSNNPILLNFEGVNKLAITLCRIEERLSNLCFSSSIHIPNYNDWIITLWHLGKDSISEYSGKTFHCEWSLAEKLIL